MLRSGLPLLEALHGMRQSATHPGTRNLLLELSYAVGQGQRLSEAMQAHPRQFTPIVVASTRAAETAGHLPETLLELADTQEAELRWRGELRGALAYPLLVAGATLLVLGLLVVAVLPQLELLYRELLSPEAWPGPARAVFTLAAIVREPLVVIALLGLLLFPLLAFLHPRGRHRLLRWARVIPWIARVQDAAMARSFARALAFLLRAGVPLRDALPMASATVPAPVARAPLADLQARVLEGQPLGDALEQSRFGPPLLRRLVRAGERSGSLQERLQDAADYFTEQQLNRIKALLRWVEPVMVLLVAALVAALVAGVFWPLFLLLEALSGPA